MTVRADAVVIGVGNPMRADDGFGPAVLGRLEADPPLDVDLVVVDGEASRLLESWRDRCCAVVVDAVVRGSPPGTVHELRVDAELPDGSKPTSSHGAGVAEAVALGRALDRLPDTLVVLGVEPARLAHGPELSRAVADQVEAVVDRVRALVEP